MEWTDERRAQVLAETIAWCASRGSLDDPATSLRTPELRPDLVTASQRVESGGALAESGQQAVQEAIAKLARDRARLLRETGSPASIPQPVDESSMAGGRLLLCESFDMSLIDGEAEFSSKGFFDGDDLPPWDTWLSPIDHEGSETARTFVAWIPPRFLHLAEAGVEANFFGCFSWITLDDHARLFRPDSGAGSSPS